MLPQTSVLWQNKVWDGTCGLLRPHPTIGGLAGVTLHGVLAATPICDSAETMEISACEAYNIAMGSSFHVPATYMGSMDNLEQQMSTS